MEHIKIYTPSEIIYDGNLEFEGYVDVGLKVQINLFNGQTVYRDLTTETSNGLQLTKEVITEVRFTQMTIDGVAHNTAQYTVN